MAVILWRLFLPLFEFIIFLLLLPNLSFSAKPHVLFRPFSKEIAAEVSLLRSNPPAYAKYLEEHLASFRDDKTYIRADGVTMITKEGIAAVKEAIGQLKVTKKLKPLSVSNELEKASRIHAVDMNEYHLAGHVGSDGSNVQQRIERFGQWYGFIGENIEFGSSKARDIVINLLVDDGITDRGHRKNLLNPQYNFIGSMLGPHKVHHLACVMNFAEEIRDSSFIELKPRKLSINPRSGLTMEFRKAINSIPGEPRYIDNVKTKLNQGFEVDLDYHPEGRAKLTFRKDGASNSLDITFSINTAIHPGHLAGEDESDESSDHKSHEDEHFLHGAERVFHGMFMLMGVSVSLAGVAYIVKLIVTAMNKKTTKKNQ